jgi:hypothetical protein
MARFMITLKLIPFLFMFFCACPLLAIFGLLAVASVMRWASMGDKILKDWAQREGLRLIHCKPQRIGSPWMVSSSAPRIYRITAEKPGGEVASAWVRCGSAFMGTLNPTIEVKWD